MDDGKMLVLETKVEGLQNDVKELYKRSDTTNEVTNDLNMSIVTLSGAMENLATKFNGSTEKLAVEFKGSMETLATEFKGSMETLAIRLDSNINRMSCDIEKIGVKNDKVDDREKKNTDSIKIAVIGAVIGIVFGIIGAYLGLK